MSNQISHITSDLRAQIGKAITVGSAVMRLESLTTTAGGDRGRISCEFSFLEAPVECVVEIGGRKRGAILYPGGHIQLDP